METFGILRLEETKSELNAQLFEITLDISEQDISTSRLKLKRNISTYLDLSKEKNNLGLSIELELKLITPSAFFQEYSYSTYPCLQVN